MLDQERTETGEVGTRKSPGKMRIFLGNMFKNIRGEYEPLSIKSFDKGDKVNIAINTKEGCQVRTLTVPNHVLQSCWTTSGVPGSNGQYALIAQDLPSRFDTNTPFGLDEDAKKLQFTTTVAFLDAEGINVHPDEIEMISMAAANQKEINPHIL